MKSILIYPFWLIADIISDIWWHFKRKQKNYERDTSNSMADDFIEDRYGI